MSKESTEDLLVVMLGLEELHITQEVMSRALAEMTRLGWVPNSSTETWERSIQAGEIRYNAWNQPTLSVFGRALAIAIREEREQGLFTARRTNQPPHPNQD